MTRRRLTRVFWLGAAAILVVAAPISLVAVLRGKFSQTDGRILDTLASLLYCGGAGLGGLASSTWALNGGRRLVDARSCLARL